MESPGMLAYFKKINEMSEGDVKLLLRQIVDAVCTDDEGRRDEAASETECILKEAGFHVLDGPGDEEQGDDADHEG